MFLLFVWVIFCLAMMYFICIVKESENNPDNKLLPSDKMIILVSVVVSPLLEMYLINYTLSEMIHLKINDIMAILGLTVPFFWFPVCMTCFNVKHLIKNINNTLSDLLTIIIGGIYHALLQLVTLDITDKSYKESVYPDQYHELLNSEYSGIIELLIVAGFIAMISLCVRKPYKTPPLVSAFSIAFSALTLVILLLIYIHMAYNFEKIHIMLYMYYINLIVITARRIRYHITEQVRLANERNLVFRSRIGEKFHLIITKISSMRLFSFMLILPIVIVCELIYIIAGQGVDGFIKAFTMTADWTFSTQIPPPPLEPDGHYLCTVAVQGHKEIVKPLRYGVRHNHRIVVNRQLLIANAFEDLIHDMMPRTHRRIRNFYDRYGYPLSKHITTRTRADIIYILMKPLEYIFLLFLYTFDVQPENRIAVQYSECKK